MKIKIYMKSGNSITISGVKDYEIGYINDDITNLKLKYKKIRFGEKLLVGSIALSQIEAISKL